MTSFLDKLNLRPQERRLVVFVGLVVFIALNFFFVYPQFGMVSFWENKKITADRKLKEYTDEVKKIPSHTTELKNLESQGYSAVGSDEAVLSLSRDVESLASLSGVAIGKRDPVQRGPARTNAFFEDAGLRISVNTGEKELVDFLFNLGTRNSLIRVRSMSLQPDPSRMRLNGAIELVESFPKKSVSKPASSSAPPTATAAAAKKPAVAIPAATTNKTTVATSAGSTNWFKKLLNKFTPGSSTTKTKATNVPPRVSRPAPGGSTTTTNPAPKTPVPVPAPK